MSKRAILVSLIVTALAASAVAGVKKQAGKAAPNAAFEKFKALAGDWTPKGENAAMVINYKVTSAGSVVVETIGAGTEHEMITVIHPDGDGVALTHYCAIGNQPQMRATGLNGKSVAFKFVRATNMKSPTDMVMHDVTYTFVDKDTLKAEWTNYNNGKPAGKMEFEHKRKK